MVVCKYFQQGTCRYGQYCRFQHIRNFGGITSNNNKQFEDEKSIVLSVAEEVLKVEKGGQWLLSCFGPFKEQPCIPGMEDVSPEEVRWEMYQAQKNGTVDQTKLQFQQLCQAMTAKREALKHPTHEMAVMLEKLQKTNVEGQFGGKGNFAMSTPQMAQPTSQTIHAFGAKSFSATGNPFGGGFNASGGSTSIFGRTPTSGASVFGAKPSFGGASVFGGQTSTFGGNQNNMQTSSNSVFGGTTGQPVFAQMSSFGATSQTNGPFSMSQGAPSTSAVFGTTTTASNSLFGASSSTLFGGSTSSSSIFGSGATAQAGNSLFGGSGAAATSSTTIGSTSIFAQPKSTAAFGGAPVFGAAGTFGAPQAPFTGFGAQPSFENPAISTSNVFGGASTQSTTFGSNVRTTSSFGALAASPFVASSTTASAPFGAPSGPFGTTANSPFARNTTFGGSMQSGNETFGVPATSAESPFATTASGATFGNVPPQSIQPFGASAFGNAPSTPFASTTSTTTTSNPFAPRSQQTFNTPFGTAQTTMSSGGAFGQTSFGTITTAAVIDETAYTLEANLTDDEKSSYLADQFDLGKIPVKPPAIKLR